MIRAARSAARIPLALLAVAFLGTAAVSEPTYRMLDFRDLSGWEGDDHGAALAVFANTCADLDSETWGPLCALAQQRPDAQWFFETFFRPVVAGGETAALFTGYYEPELIGSPTPDDRFRYAVYARPPEADAEWFSRQEIEERKLLEGQGLEIAWVEDPVDLFFLQIQGSGRIRFPDGSALRLGYGGGNGQPYRSIGAELVRRGEFQAHQVSAAAIRKWVRDNPEAGQELLNFNPSYVFFRTLPGLRSDLGPLGAMNRPITPLRSVAVDPAFVPLGAPVWVEKSGRSPMRRLMVAQDTGAAIKGAQRADIFFGTGAQAGRRAGRIRDGGRLVMLLPIEMAFRLRPEG